MTSDIELPLPEFADLERVPPPPKPRYRCKVEVQVLHTGYIEYNTDGDPEVWLELDDNVSQPLDDVVSDGDTDWWDWIPEYGPIDVSYDDGVTWERWKRER